MPDLAEKSTHKPLAYREPPLADTSPLEETLEAIEADLEHRERFKAFVLRDAEAWHREHLGRLFTHWHMWNTAFYGDGMKPPYIMLAEPSSPRVYGDTSKISAFGGRCQIRLRPSLLIGTHPHVRPEPDYAEGRVLLIADVLLHEMVHQYHFEVSGDVEHAFHGHGPHFRDVCNRIGQAFGLPPVRSSKKRVADAHLPSCAHWPFNVRPPEYYQGAYVLPVPPMPTPRPIAVCTTCEHMATLAADALEHMVAASPKKYHRNPHYQTVETLLEDIIGLVPPNGDDDGEEGEP